jgi:molybdopterin molybdotransferase
MTDPSKERPLLSVDQALDLLRQHAPAAKDVEKIACVEANGRVLAGDLVADRDVPRHDNSAMDGYAVRTRDIGPEEVSWLPVDQQIPAGHLGSELAPGSAARILTGAPIPSGADAVVKQEVCSLRNGRVGIPLNVQQGANIRPRGEDIRSATVVLGQGMRLGPPEIAIAAALGLTQLPVFRKPRVAVLSTGTEVVEPGHPIGEGQIYDSNRYALIALIKAVGCDAIDCGHLPDDLGLTRQGMLAACNGADLVLTSGGVSVGDEDHVRHAIEAEGTLHAWRIAIKPGKPVAFGSIAETPVIGLPGNPGAAFVTFLMLVRPFLKCMQGHQPTRREGFRMAAGFAVSSSRTRRRYLRARVDLDDAGVPRVVLSDKQGSAILTTLSWADGLADIPEGETVEPGQLVNFLPFSELLS